MNPPAPSAEAAPSEQMLAKERIEELVWDELLRAVNAIRVDRVLGATPDLSIRIDGYASNGPALVINEEHLSGPAISRLEELAGQNLELCLDNGRLMLFSPSWRYDEIPF